jgi:hypothetical protein
MNVKPRVMRNRHGEHEAVMVSVEVEPDEWPERCEESEADGCCGNTFKKSGGDPGTPLVQDHCLTLGSNQNLTSVIR